MAIRQVTAHYAGVAQIDGHIPRRIQAVSAILQTHDGIFELSILVHEEGRDVLHLQVRTAENHRDAIAGSTMAFCTTPASRDHFEMAYSFTTCFFVLTTQSATKRLRAESDMLGMLGPAYET